MFRNTVLTRLAATSALLNKGKVVSWMSGRGFGFIEDDADKKQHFVHFSALKVEAGGFRALTVGQEVEFDVVTVDGRTKADNVAAPGGANLPSGPRPPPQDNFRQGGRGFGGGRGRGFGGGRGRGFGGGRGRGGFNNNNNNQSNNNFQDGGDF